MALPLSVFKTVPLDCPTTSTIVYTAPVGYTAIVLTAQAVNTDPVDPFSFSMTLKRGSLEHPLVTNYEIPHEEVLIASGGTAGKLVLQTGDSLMIQGESNLIKFTLSVLETLV
jgi:hypothetical protein